MDLVAEVKAEHLTMLTLYFIRTLLLMDLVAEVEGEHLELEDPRRHFGDELRTIAEKEPWAEGGGRRLRGDWREVRMGAGVGVRVGVER